VIVNYDKLHSKKSKLNQYKFRRIVLDEGHLIKNANTKKYSAISQLQATYRWIVTGTEY
jgi:SWI/SNF-related matrix-associated actin-dependent regulator of chromatin subfamily A3